MERVALVLRTRDRGVEEIEVEVRVVPDQDRALAMVAADRRAHRREHVVERVLLGFGEAERVVEHDAGDFQRLRVDLGARRGLDVRAGHFAGNEFAGIVEFDRDRGDLQQRVPVPVEAAGFHVHHHRQEAAETLGHRPHGAGCGDGRFGLCHRRQTSRRRCAGSMDGYGGSTVPSRLSRGGSGESPLTRNQVFSAMLVAWSPMRSRFLAMNSRCVHGVMLCASSIM